MTLVLALYHLELQDFILAKRFERALSALRLKFSNAFAKVRDHPHDLLDTLPSLIALSYQIIQSRKRCCGCCDALNYHGLIKLLAKELRQGNC